MASSEEFLHYVLDLLGDVSAVRYRKMMGEYVIYVQDRVVGGIYDDRFLLKVTPASRAMLAHAVSTSPYPGAKEMLVVDSDDRALVAAVVEAMAP